MNEHFSKHIEQVIQNYENQFINKRNMSVKRSQDIIEIRGIIKDDLKSKDISACIQILKNYLKKMRTGQWIFRTGRSQLRDSLNNIISHYENPVSQSLLQYVNEVKYQLDTMTDKAEKSNSTCNSAKSNEVDIDELIKEIQRLTEENEFLRHQNHELSQKVIESKRSTQYQTPPSSPRKAQGDDVCYSPRQQMVNEFR